jgi:hypothetical protein
LKEARGIVNKFQAAPRPRPDEYPASKLVACRPAPADLDDMRLVLKMKMKPEQNSVRDPKRGNGRAACHPPVSSSLLGAAEAVAAESRAFRRGTIIGVPQEEDFDQQILPDTDGHPAGEPEQGLPR